jgi:hypothetical protein
MPDKEQNTAAKHTLSERVNSCMHTQKWITLVNVSVVVLAPYTPHSAHGQYAWGRGADGSGAVGQIKNTCKMHWENGIGNAHLHIGIARIVIARIGKYIGGGGGGVRNGRCTVKHKPHKTNPHEQLDTKFSYRSGHI